MKVSFFTKTLIFLSCALFYAEQTTCLPTEQQQRAHADLTTEQDKPSSLSRDQNKKLKRLTDNLNAAIFDTLIDSMQTLEANLEYWDKAKKSPTYHALHNPAGWLDSRETTTAIQDCIKNLETLEKEHAEYLGTFYRNQQYQNSLTPDAYAHNSLIFYFPDQHTEAPSNQTLYEPGHLDYEQLCSELHHRTIQVKKYKQIFNKKINSYKQPSHVARNWWKYALGTVAAGCTIWQINKHKEKIPGLYNDVCTTAEENWQKHVTGPIKEIWKNLTQNSAKNKNVAPRPTLEENVRKNLTEYLVEKDKHTDPALIYDTIAVRVDVIINGNPTELINDMNKESQSLRSNIFGYKFQLPHTLALLGQYLHLQGNKELEIQKVNIMLGAMFPAFLLLYGTQKASGALFSKLFLKKGIYKALQNRVSRMFRMLLNLHDLHEKNVPLEQHGKLLYYLTTLDKYAALTPLEHHDTLKKDIETLKSTTCSVQTKIKTIEQMYRVYPFLQSNAN